MYKLRNTSSYMDETITSPMSRPKRCSHKKEQRMTDYEYRVYLKNLRILDDNSKISTMCMADRMKYHKMLQRIMKISALLTGLKTYTINTTLPQIPDGRPIIFVVTHVGKNDITVFSEFVKQHFTILSGDYESMHNRIEGLICAINGTIYFDMKSRTERKEIVNRVVKILEDGDSILCSMEAAWNISPNEIVYDLFPGMIDVAIQANAVIIPIGLERFNEKTYGFNMSTEIFDPLLYMEEGAEYEDILGKAKKDLRGRLAELKFELYFLPEIQKLISARRSELGDLDAYEKFFVEDVLQGWTFTEQDIEEKKYRNRVKPIYAYSYVIEKYSFRVRHGLTPSDYAELWMEINNPVYPNHIRNKLADIACKYSEWNNNP